MNLRSGTKTPGWSSSNQQIPDSYATPPSLIYCSICYPYQVDTSDCKERKAILVSRNLLASSPSSSFKYHIRSFFLGKALIYKYSDDSLNKLYLAFVNEPFKTESLNQTCNKKFNKQCSDLSPEETVSLDLAFRSGKLDSTEFNYQTLKSNLFNFCQKKE